jgi:hypothetical protein
MKHVLLRTVWMLLGAIPAAWCAPNEAADVSSAVVRLRDAVEVKRERVRLSDLLPPDAPLALQKTGAAIELCPSPQPGSVRVLDKEQITSKLAAQPETLRWLAIPLRVTVRYIGWPIEEAPVRVAISRFLRDQDKSGQAWNAEVPEAARLEWARPLASSEENARLQVTSLDWDNRQRSVEVRLRCAARASCGSFLVHVVLPSPLDDRWRDWLRSGTAPSLSTATQPVATTASGALLAHKGKPATLILDDGTMRISLHVVCLQPGVLNQQIRVFDEKSRRVFNAEVVGAGLLRAAL